MIEFKRIRNLKSCSYRPNFIWIRPQTLGLNRIFKIDQKMKKLGNASVIMKLNQSRSLYLLKDLYIFYKCVSSTTLIVSELALDGIKITDDGDDDVTEMIVDLFSFE